MRSRPGRPRRVLAGAALALLLSGCGAEQPVAPAAPVAPTPTTTAPAADRPTVLAESRPERVVIPALGVDSAMMDLGLQDDGTMEVPPDGTTAGWYALSPTPGEIGPAVLAAHVDWKGEPGVFHRLRDTEPGDEVRVRRADGSTAVFTVDRVEQYAKDSFPSDAVYGDVDRAELRLITCGGEFDGGTGDYEDNIVVYARLTGAA
ncbi:class F sortase [Pseudonocardia broussonetiae]|uniref:class F sortase n=1 Tax=Pseudonocardia broussonetiae TaxID=2736640 RepID=UPI001F04B782|nr:class F sortase [Pseudonocardia broussonetiae]